ncbi:hypothetical protein SBA6_480002 [Candidatus Sulfopaludibacter sp. SbA6]|nr:hypothetical protein SBA6_480002 [Candidatus Sulfopaludibacter sp. SbA6]
MFSGRRKGLIVSGTVGRRGQSVTIRRTEAGAGAAVDSLASSRVIARLPRRRAVGS